MNDKIINVADIKMPSGKTWREENLELKHRFKEGDLVTFTDSYSQKDKVIKQDLYVQQATRDCDGTPLYTLSLKHPEELKRFLRALEELGLINREVHRIELVRSFFVSAGLITGISENSVTEHGVKK
jgi:hypothetical protein